MAATWDGHGAPSLPELRARLIPTGESRSWDEGELARAVLNLDDHASLVRCEVLIGLACVARRSRDGTEASRAAALREGLVEIMGGGPAHLSYRGPRAL